MYQGFRRFLLKIFKALICIIQTHSICEYKIILDNLKMSI